MLSQYDANLKRKNSVSFEVLLCRYESNEEHLKRSEHPQYYLNIHSIT